MEVVDGSGGGDESIHAMNEPWMEEEIIELLAARQTIDDILGTAPGEQVSWLTPSDRAALALSSAALYGIEASLVRHAWIN